MANLKIIFDASISKAMAAINALTTKNEEAKKKIERPAEAGGNDRRSALEEVRTAKIAAEAAKREKIETQTAIRNTAAAVREAEAVVKSSDEKSAAYRNATSELEKQRKELERLKALGTARGQAADLTAQNLHAVRTRARATAPVAAGGAGGASEGWFSRMLTAGQRAATGIEAGFSRMRARISSIFSGVSGVISGALAFAGIGIGAATLRQMINDLDNLGKSARNMGVSAEELQKFQYAAQSVNFPVEQIQPSFDKMRKIIGDAVAGMPEAKKKLDLLGVSLDDLKGKGTAEQFDIVSRAILGIKDPTEQASAAMSIFGEQGGKMLEFMRNYKRAGADLEARGAIIDNRDVAAAEAFNQACTNIAMSLRSWTVNTGFIRKLQEIAEGMDAMATNADKMMQHRITETNKESIVKTTTRWRLNGIGGLIGMGTIWGDKGLGDRMLPNTEGHTTAPITPKESMADKARREKEKAEAAEREKRRKEAQDKEKREKAEKFDSSLNEQLSSLERKVAGKDDDVAVRRKAAVDEEIAKAERNAKASEVEFDPERRKRLADAAGAAFDAEEAKKDRENGQKVDEQIKALEEKHRRQNQIIAGKAREAAIAEEMEKAEKTARDAGNELTKEQRDRIAATAGANFDLEVSQERGNITGPVNNVYSDALLRMGGIIGGIGQGPTTDYARRTSQTLDTMHTKLNDLYDKIPNRTEQGEITF